MLIYSTQYSNRFKYLLHFIFEEQFGLEIKHTDNIDEYISYHGFKMNYSNFPLEENDLFLQSSNLLFDKGVKHIEIQKVKEKSILCPFKVSNESSIFSFDLFSAVFYHISRYEEYLPHLKDRMGRFPASSSLSFESGTLEEPIVNIWLQWFRTELKAKFHDIELKSSQYKFIPTYDIDIAYSYKHKGLIRNFGGLLKDIKDGKFKDLRSRIKVHLGKEKDPFDTYNYQEELCKKYDLDPIYFILLGQYAQYDRNISFETLGFQNLIRNLNDKYITGIHPSFRSNDDKDIVKMEINKLARLIKREIKRSRQHFIKLHLPHTYQNLLDLDIVKDYSMGYPDRIGYRAGFAGSFLFYDLTTERQTKLRIYPFVMMDVTMNAYMKLSIEEAKQKIDQVIFKVKEVDGLLMSIWHNHTLCDKDNWKGWREVYAYFLDKASIE